MLDDKIGITYIRGGHEYKTFDEILEKFKLNELNKHDEIRTQYEVEVLGGGTIECQP